LKKCNTAIVIVTSQTIALLLGTSLSPNGTLLLDPLVVEEDRKRQRRKIKKKIQV